MTTSKTNAAFVRRFAAPVGLIAGLAFVFPACAENASAANRCARLGKDYVAVSGTDGCVRLGGHVRVKLTQTPPAAPMGYAANEGFINAAARTAHVRANSSPFGLLDLFPR